MRDQFTMTFDLGNSALSGDNIPHGVAAILRALAIKVEDGQTGGVVKDENGNTVGKWSLDTPDEG